VESANRFDLITPCVEKGVAVEITEVAQVDATGDPLLAAPPDTSDRSADQTR